MAQIRNTKVIGAEWVNNYNHPFIPKRSNLLRCYQNVKGFYNTLTGIRRFIYGDGQAWDQDIEQNFNSLQPPPANPNGDDDSYAEKVDILYFAGHGTQDGLLYGVPDYDNGEARYDEMQLGQGGIIKWFVADTCKLLEESGVQYRWRNLFKGLRYVLGFHGDCRDVGDRGWRFASHLNGVPTNQATAGAASAALSGETIWHAWQLACLETEALADLTCAYLRAGGTNSVIHNDRWTDVLLETDASALLTYWRNVPPAIS